MDRINLHNYEAYLIDYLDGNLNEAAIMELKAFILANPQLDIDLEDFDLPSFEKDETKVDFKNDLKRSEVFIEDEELINYLEANLSEAERKAFEYKLQSNKDLILKLEAYKKTILSQDTSVMFTSKENLHKTEDEMILNNSVLAYFEGQLNVSDKLKFEKELNSEISLQKELKLFQNTKQEADNTIVFEDKETLKRETKVVVLFSFRTVASVAAAVLLLLGLAFVFNYYSSKPGGHVKEIAKNQTNNKSLIGNDSVANPNSLLTSHKLPEPQDFIAKNNKAKPKHNSVKKNVQQINQGDVNPLIVKEEKNKDDSLLEQGADNESKPVLANNKFVEDSGNVALANTNLNTPKYSKQNYLITVEENDEADVSVVPEKKGFWQRAVKLARQVNKLGVKAIDGEETQGKNYSLSFNSFSVEKR